MKNNSGRQGPFKKIYWGSDRSTEVTFEPGVVLPQTEQISACVVVAVHQDTVVLSRPKRGWGLLGGHREEGETAEVCIRREAMEEATVELGNLKLIGWWKTRKLFESSENCQYPALAYQLLYVAHVTKVHDFLPQYEVQERTFIPLDQVADLHHNFPGFEEVYEFILASKEVNRCLEVGAS
jgi:8-oxo-dGTP diphosphatase